MRRLLFLLLSTTTLWAADPFELAGPPSRVLAKYDDFPCDDPQTAPDWCGVTELALIWPDNPWADGYDIEPCGDPGCENGGVAADQICRDGMCRIFLTVPGQSPEIREFTRQAQWFVRALTWPPAPWRAEVRLECTDKFPGTGCPCDLFPGCGESPLP